MRVFIAGLFTETNTFAPFLTGRGGFKSGGISRQGSRSDRGLTGPLTTFRTLTERDGHEIVESVSAFAQPAGRVVRGVYEALRDDILDDLRAAGEIDIVLLLLHGAMIAQGYDDCEADILARIRQIVPAAVIGVELDPHCHLTAEMVDGADLIVISREYPHTDFVERAEDLYKLALATARREIVPVAALVDCRMLGFYPTFDPPMKGVVDAFRASGQGAGMLTAELAHGFPWADVADVGTRVLVYADREADLASREALRLAEFLYRQRHSLSPTLPDIATSLDRAAALDGRVVLGDFADNPGGGGPGDSTFFLRALLDRGISDAVIGAIWDPHMAEACSDAGVGAIVPLRLGGKCGPTSGDPIDLVVEVMAVEEDHSQGAMGQRAVMGRSVWVRAGGIDIVICSIRMQVYEPDVFTGLGIPLEDRPLVIVKSSNHYRAAFGMIADHLWHVASPGCMTLDFQTLPYTKISQPIFPFVDDPCGQHGPRQIALSNGRSQKGRS